MDANEHEFFKPTILGSCHSYLPYRLLTAGYRPQISHLPSSIFAGASRLPRYARSQELPPV